MEFGNNVLVGGGKQGAVFWVWTEQYPKGTRTGRGSPWSAYTSSEQGRRTSVAQPGSTHSACADCPMGRGSWLPESYWDGLPAKSSVELPPILFFQVSLGDK